MQLKLNQNSRQHNLNNTSEEELHQQQKKRRADQRRDRNHSTLATTNLKKEDLMNIKEHSMSRSSSRSCAMKEYPVKDIARQFERQTNRDFNSTFNTMMQEEKTKRPTYKMTQDQRKNLALTQLLSNQYKEHIDAFPFPRRR